MEERVLDINTTALAYMGDAVYEIYVREHVLEMQDVHVDSIHKKSVHYVNAKAQSGVLKEMIKGSFLTSEELALAKRARNHKIISKAKNADPVDYKNATAFEALLGYLYLSKDEDRLKEVVFKAFSIVEAKFDK